MPFLMILLIFLFSTSAFGEIVKESPLQVWRVSDRRWTVEEEHQFGKWVEENVTEDFFIRYKIPVDCADVPYALRWIYARIDHLPAAATTKDNRLIGHWSTNWDHLPTHPEWHRDQRFRAALLFITVLRFPALSNALEFSLMSTSFPIDVALWENCVAHTLEVNLAHRELWDDLFVPPKILGPRFWALCAICEK